MLFPSLSSASIAQTPLSNHYVIFSFLSQFSPSYMWYIYSLVFFQCVWFCMIIILHTYRGIIAYPRIPYGYLILVFMTLYGPRLANLVLIAYASSEGSDEPAHPRSLARTFAARSYKQWIKRNLQTESQIPGPSEWLGMRSWNLSWRNARRHKFAWRGSYYIVEIFNKFGKSYQKLLQLTIKATKNVNHFSAGQTVELQNNKGIPKALWELIIERHQTRRLKVASTILQLAVLISILYVSVKLLHWLNQFQELSVTTYVFTVLAICALLKIVRSVYINKLCGQQKQLMRDIENTILDFLEDNIADHAQV